MTDDNGRERPPRLRAFVPSRRTRGAIAAGVAAAVAVLPEFSLNLVLRLVILAAAALLGGYLFLRSQDEASRQPGQAPGHDAGRPAQPEPAAPPAPGRPRGRVRRILLGGPAAAWVALFGQRKERDRRRLRLRPHMLPEPLPFAGRASELGRLRDLHDRQRRRGLAPRITAVAHRVPWLKSTRAAQGARGHRIVYLYGRPGVGKSALANEFAHSLKHLYPHGQLYMNMGVGGGRRSERHILRDFLRELGLPEEEFGAERDEDAVGRLGKTFLAATAGRRLLVVLDAARDPRQIEAVLPGGNRCAIIVTSRARIPGTEAVALKLDTPGAAEAAQILRAHLAGPGQRANGRPPSAELVAEAAHLCGRQPIALHAAADRASAVPGGLGEVVRELSDPKGRLGQLAYGGRDVAERIRTVYGRITPIQRLALQALTFIGAPSFTPWVLQPMLDIDLPEAAALMAALALVNLLDDFGTDPAGFPRYGFSPLIRLFAEQELRQSLEEVGPDSDLLRGAPQRFARTCAVLAKRVLARREAELTGSGEPLVPDGWIPAGIRSWERRVLESADFWNRTEFANLIDAVRAASEDGFDAIAWILFAQLGGGDVFHPFTPQVSEAYDRAWAANGTGDLRVLLAAGSCLLAGERHDKATAVLTDVLRAASDPSAAAARARANRLIGQAEQRLGRYASAMKYLSAALSEAGRAHQGSQGRDELDTEVRIAQLLIAENESFTRPSRWRPAEQVRFPPSRDGISYTEHLVAARMARRRRDARGCEEELGNAYRAIDNDETHAFQLQLERVLLKLERHHRPGGQLRADIIAQCASLAVTARAAGAEISSAEARLALARGLLDDGRPDECRRTLAALRLDEISSAGTPRLRALSLRLLGEADFAAGKLPEAEHSLAQAVRQFSEMNDPWGQAEARTALGLTQLKAGKPTDAQVTLLRAIEVFEQCGDTRNARRALALLAPSAALLAVKAGWARCSRLLAR